MSRILGILLVIIVVLSIASVFTIAVEAKPKIVRRTVRFSGVVEEVRDKGLKVYVEGINRSIPLFCAGKWVKDREVYNWSEIKDLFSEGMEIKVLATVVRASGRNVPVALVIKTDSFTIYRARLVKLIRRRIYRWIRSHARRATFNATVSEVGDNYIIVTKGNVTGLVVMRGKWVSENGTEVNWRDYISPNTDVAIRGFVVKLPREYKGAKYLVIPLGIKIGDTIIKRARR
ncbi:MAG: hypothetical protein B6U94_08500 [Thermofilum sp. ex4484_79]|nr:MAG: hypothetical protein B6U94_08500 [Thermofilum sp. ex4484_79]